MKRLHEASQARPKMICTIGIAVLALAGCEGGGTAPAGVGTVGGAVAGAGTSRMLFGNSTSGMLIGGAVGGLAGNMMLDRQAEERQRQQAETTRDATMQRQLDFERQRALQEEEVRVQIEEERLFREWQRERTGT
jgi:Na+/glutamate symporter